jgi:hypothetical protein
MSATTLIPERTIEQRMSALGIANDVRTRRARFKRDLKAGRENALARLECPPEWIDTMRVFDLLLALPKVGRVKANAMLGAAKVSPSKRVGGLTDVQRRELANILRRRV